MAQRDRRVNFRRAPGRKVTGRHCRCREDKRNDEGQSDDGNEEHGLGLFGFRRECAEPHDWREWSAPAPLTGGDAII